MHHRWFWLANLALLILYLWTMTEASAVHVQVDGEICTAVFPERHDLTRTSSVRCPNLRGGFAVCTLAIPLETAGVTWGHWTGSSPALAGEQSSSPSCGDRAAGWVLM